MTKTWAKAILNTNACILDTETTGTYKDSQVIQLCIIDMAGNVLFDSLFRPTVDIHSAAVAIHHITKYHLRNAPLWTDMIDDVEDVLRGRTVIAYNASFDKRMLAQTLQTFGLGGVWFDKLDWQCAMRAYAEFLGVRNSPKLTGGDHSAKGDAIATLRVIREMAGADEPVAAETEAVCSCVTVRPAPPADMVTHMIAYLESLATKGRTPPDDWLPWLLNMDRALKAADVVQIEILGKSSMAKFLNIDELKW